MKLLLGIMYPLWLPFRSMQIGMETCIQATKWCTWLKKYKGKGQSRGFFRKENKGDGMTIWQEKEKMKKR